ncbi:MAG TPA: nucleotide exchange factor GrpE, partial [Amnibacterium sp.]|nr:nucleotide exchange factor GrpE [Amnibacterium sp.]
TIAQKLRGAAGKLGLTPFGETGQLFDPREHDAIFQRENPTVEKATVSDVVERGYRVGDTVLRPAKVVVDTPAS